MPLKLPSVPSWLLQVLAAAAIGVATAWASGMSDHMTVHIKDIAVLQTRQDATERDIVEIKMSQRRVEDKLDRVLERRGAK